MAHGFRSTYRSISLNDLRNIYSGPERASKIELTCRESSLDRKLTKRDRLLEETHKMLMERKYTERFNEYVPEYKTYLPKAPAFRETNDKNVKEIVERLFHPQELVRRSKMRHKKVPKQQVRKSEPYSEADINDISERLFSSETQCFRNRQVVRNH